MIITVSDQDDRRLPARAAAHPDAEFSHGLRPDCAAKTWGGAG